MFNYNVYNRIVFRATKVQAAPNLPTKIIPTKIAWLKLSRNFPMDMKMFPLKIKIMLESNPLKSWILVWRLAVRARGQLPQSSELSISQSEGLSSSASVVRKSPNRFHTCHILPPSEIDLGLCLAVFAGSGGKYLFHRIGWKGRIWQLWISHETGRRVGGVTAASMVLMIADGYFNIDILNDNRRWTKQTLKLFTPLDLRVSSLHRGHANILCTVPMLTDDPRRGHPLNKCWNNQTTLLRWGSEIFQPTSCFVVLRTALDSLYHNPWAPVAETTGPHRVTIKKR